MSAPDKIFATAYYSQNRSEHVQSWSEHGFEGKQHVEYTRTDLTPAAVAAALEGAAARLRELVPAPAGGPFSHTNTARVVALDAVSIVAALITAPQRDALQAVIDVAKAEARAEVLTQIRDTADSAEFAGGGLQPVIDYVAQIGAKP